MRLVSVRSGITLFLALVLVVSVVGESAGSLFNKGRHAEARQDYIAAYEFYKKAWDMKPEELKYRVSVQRTALLAAAAYVKRGQLLRDSGRLQDALVAFGMAKQIDPSSFIADQELRKTQKMIDEANGTAPPPKASLLDKRLQQAQGPVELAPISNTPITLHFSNEDTRTIYQTVGKLAGLNVLFDPDYTSRRIPIDLNNVTLSDALDIVALESKTFWRPVTKNTIFVAQDSVQKRREVETNVVKTFYLSNVSTPTELQDVVNAIRTVLEVSRIQQMPSQNAIVIRGTPDQVALASKLIDDIDKAKPEVVIDVAVLQVNKDRLRDLGIGRTVPTNATVQLQSPTVTTTTPTTPGTTPGTTTTTPTTTTTGQINLNQLANLNATDFVVTIPGFTANALFSDATTKVIQNPQIRSSDGVKASLKIGDRVPVATGSFQPGIGGVGINPLVNTQFQYLDVGVNIDITPRVHADREVSLKVAIDVSAVTRTTNIGGIDQPVIGQRKIEHEIRLREGEVNLLGGILEHDDTRSLSGIPGLAQIPILRYLFAEDKKEIVENEIVFALVPHIVRAQDLTELNTQELDVGTGTSIELRRTIPATPAKQNVSVVTPPTTTVPSTSPVMPPPPVTTTTTPNQPATNPPTTTTNPPSTTGTPPSNTNTNAIATPNNNASTPSNAVTLAFDPPATMQSVGGTFAVNVKMASGSPIVQLPAQITYDPKLLQLLNVSNGGFLSKDGQPVALVHRDDASSGTITVNATRPPGSGGVTGEGIVFTLTFQAKAKGVAGLAIPQANARDTAMQPIPVTASAGSVTIL